MLIKSNNIHNIKAYPHLTSVNIISTFTALSDNDNKGIFNIKKG